MKLLIFFYCFVIVQHFSMRAQFKMNPGVEAVMMGTLIYLVYGFLRREQAARWTGILFHTGLQVAETMSLAVLLNPGMLDAMLKDVPAQMSGVARGSLLYVFAFVTLINISAVVYLWKNAGHFGSPEKKQEPEEAA